ncbi:MAG TPA: hypothetical protein DEH22_12990 [Chloroflexi bacterium]|nr:hypothetical protein [Chloroflexota bacterium]
MGLTNYPLMLADSADNLLEYPNQAAPRELVPLQNKFQRDAGSKNPVRLPGEKFGESQPKNHALLTRDARAVSEN